ncbi:signal peptidase I [Isoptericola sp. b490]|uniref:signal peptidase I n=1 Tax=Actinotalea lenta TaxID=3064654 RepID=UPI002713BEE8|nr:signal peptidase I [Isoptericola sp. b490]MDO8119849.1 signal peptidase I [Isoptericola sp. b490]
MTRVRRVLVSALVVLVVGLAVGAAVAWHEGYRLYAVRTGSMAPTYPTGALVVDGPADDAEVGDVITFHAGGGMVTHRVHAVSGAGYSTKGDANPEPDAWTIPHHAVLGRVVAGTGALGYVLVFFRQPTGAASLMSAFVGLWLLWGLFFPPDVPGRTPAARRDRTHGPAPGTAPATVSAPAH